MWIAAVDLLGSLKRLLLWFRLGEELSSLLAQVGVCVVVALVAWVANAVAKGWIVHWLHDLIGRTRNRWDDYLSSHQVFERLSHVAPAMIFYSASAMVFPHSKGLQSLLERFAMIYIVIVMAWVLHSLIDMVVVVFRGFDSTKDKPLDSYAQLFRGIVWAVAGILILAEVMDRSPWALLGGLGALSAILLLVFRDAILGFVASVQMTTLDLVRKGDWIEMPKFGVNGVVIDFSLTTIKVQNFDKTISTVPSYAIISDTFKNWRGMSEAGGRRIKRSISLDMTSVKFVDQPLLESLREVELLEGYLAEKLEEIQQWNAEREVDLESLVNGRRITNLGTFRAYLDAYLRAHPKLSQSMTFLVRQLPPSTEGIGLELYVFTTEVRWEHYEGIMADIFDHILAVIPCFELRVFQKPTGSDVRALAEVFRDLA